MFSDSSTAAATFAALLMVFVSRGVSGQSTSLIPLVRPSSMSTLSATATSTESISSTTSGPSLTASVTTMNPTSEATTEVPTATKAPSRVTFGDWKAKDGECSKCSSGGAGPITLERECKPTDPAYSCDGFNTTMEAQDCLKYCDSSAANRKFTSVFLLLGVLISFSTSFTIWE